MVKTYQQMVAEAKARIREATADDLRGMIERGEAVVVDVREDADYAAGHLPGALHLGRGVLEQRAEKALPDADAPIVCYCGGGSRSALAADTLQAMGYTNVRSLAGGFRGWKAAGNPTQKE